MLVDCIPVTANPGVARAEIAIWVILRKIGGLWLFRLALPGSLGAMRRDEDVFAGQRVVPPVWMSSGVEIHEGRMVVRSRLEASHGRTSDEALARRYMTPTH